MTHSRLHSVIPPYILRHIIDHGAPPQQQFARQTLMHVQTLMAEHYGKTAAHPSAASGDTEREIYDAQNTQALPGKLVRKEGQPSNGDIAADEAWEYLGVTHQFFWNAWQRDSLDNKGMILSGTVHYGQDYQNAF